MLVGMARDESSREDLLREATALVERIELVPRGVPESTAETDMHVVAGFRSNGAMSVFFGDDPVYQFNAAGELRRAYREGKLYKAVGGQLVSLQRMRQKNEVQLVRHNFTSEEQAVFLKRMVDDMLAFSKLLDTDALEVVGQVPANSDLLSRTRCWLASRTHWAVAGRPNVGP
jgi:hypothetical protein